MILIESAGSKDRADVERLIAAYHASEGLKPNLDRISWAVGQRLRKLFPGLLLVARQEKAVVGVVLAVYTPSAELGRVLVVNDFYVDTGARRQGVGRSLGKRLLEEAKNMQVDRIDLEVLPTNKVAAMFWESLGFRTEGRKIYSRNL